MMVCNVKACVETATQDISERPRNFPLRIQPSMDGVVVAETLYSKPFMLHILKSIDYSALVQTTKELNHPDVPVLPEQLPEDYENADELLQLIHKVIFDTNIVEGELICNNCARSYPIQHAVPNMLLEEDEMMLGQSVGMISFLRFDSNLLPVHGKRFAFETAYESLLPSDPKMKR